MPGTPPPLLASLPSNSNSDPPEGPSFVLVSRKDGNHFRPYNPFQLGREVRSICSSPLKWVKSVASGSLLFSTNTIEQSRTILAISELLGHPVETKLADRLSSAQGTVHAPDLVGMTVQEVLEELQDQGVTEVQRFQSKQDTPNPLLRLRFRGTELPEKIVCGYLSIKVKPWLDMPRQCRKCWRIGHVERSCRSRTSICGQCSAADSHHHTECDHLPKCPGCTGPHQAWDRKACPLWDAAIKAARRNTVPTASRSTAPSAPPPQSPRSEPDVDWPTLPSSTPTSSPSAARPPARPPVALAHTDTQTDPPTPPPQCTTNTHATQTDAPTPPTNTTDSHCTQTDNTTPQTNTSTQTDKTTPQNTTGCQYDTADTPALDTHSTTSGTQTETSFSVDSSVSDADSSAASASTTLSTSSTQTGIPDDAPARIQRFSLRHRYKGSQFIGDQVLVNGKLMSTKRIPLLLRPGTVQHHNVTTAEFICPTSKMELILLEEGPVFEQDGIFDPRRSKVTPK